MCASLLQQCRLREPRVDPVGLSLLPDGSFDDIETHRCPDDLRPAGRFLRSRAARRPVAKVRMRIGTRLPFGTSRSRGRGGGTKMPVTFASPRRVILLLDKFPPRFFSKHRCSFSLPVISAPVTRCAPKKTFLVSKTLKPGFTSPCNRPAASILQRRLRPSPPLHFTSPVRRRCKNRVRD